MVEPDSPGLAESDDENTDPGIQNHLDHIHSLEKTEKQLQIRLKINKEEKAIQSLRRELENQKAGSDTDIEVTSRRKETSRRHYTGVDPSPDPRGSCMISIASVSI
jgi:hypothetical protein